MKTQKGEEKKIALYSNFDTSLDNWKQVFEQLSIYQNELNEYLSKY